MTNVIASIEPRSIYFEIHNHAGDHDVCTAISALTNVLVIECMHQGIDVKEYESGSVVIDINHPSKAMTAVALAVYRAMQILAEENHKFLKINVA